MASASLVVKTIDGAQHDVTADLAGTVRQLKERLAERCGVPVERQRLILKGRVLADERTLQESGIQDGFVLHLVQRPDDAPAAAPAQPAAQPPPQPHTDAHAHAGPEGTVANIATLSSMMSNLIGNIMPQVTQVMQTLQQQQPAAAAPAAEDAVSTAQTAAREHIRVAQQHLQQVERELQALHEPATSEQQPAVHAPSSDIVLTEAQRAAERENLRAVAGLLRTLTTVQLAMQPMLERLADDLEHEDALTTPEARQETQRLINGAACINHLLLQMHDRLHLLLGGVLVAQTQPGFATMQLQGPHVVTVTPNGTAPSAIPATIASLHELALQTARQAEEMARRVQGMHAAPAAATPATAPATVTVTAPAAAPSAQAAGVVPMDVAPALPAHSLEGLTGAEPWMTSTPGVLEAERAVWVQTLLQDRERMRVARADGQPSAFSDFYELSHPVVERRKAREEHQTLVAHPEQLIVHLLRNASRTAGVPLPATFVEQARQANLNELLLQRLRHDAQQRLDRQGS